MKRRRMGWTGGSHGRVRWPRSGRVERRLAGTLLVVSVVTGGCESPTGQVRFEDGPLTIVNFDSFGNDLVRFDLDGNPLDAHGGQINRFDDTYYLYGETYACGFQWVRQEPVPFCGFRVYSSPNLVEWKDHGLLFDVSQWDPWQSRCHWWTNGCFRPHVVFNERTGKYVLWVNAYADPVNYYVLESDSPTGPFIERGVPRLAFNVGAGHGQTNNGDQNLFVDHDGTGYVIYTEWRNFRGDLVIEKLTSDYLSGTGEYARLGTRGSESPSLFERGGRYYVTASTPPNGGYATSATSYFTADSPLGPWSGATEISRNSCGGQPFHVSELPSVHGGSWYLYQSDLWLGKDREAPGDPNQAPAGLYWEPLRFDERGEILPIACVESVQAPAVITVEPREDPEYWHLVCDIGLPVGPSVRHREMRFVAGRSGRLREVVINAYQRYEPGAPLTVEIVAREDGVANVIGTKELVPKPPAWLDYPEIAWTATEIPIPFDVPVREGGEYAIRLRSNPGQGCYGLAVRDDLPVDRPHSFVSLDGGLTWRPERGRTIRYRVVVEG